MPWKNQSGGDGPWGGGSSGGGGGSGSGNGGGPWGGSGGPSGPSGRGPTPPGLDDLIRQSQDRMKRLMPGGLFGGFGILLIAAIVIVVWVGYGFYRVEPGEQGVVLRFGAHVDTTLPGLNFHWPSPIESVEVVDVLQERQTVVGVRNIGVGATGRDSIDYITDESRMVTSDENLIDLGFVVVWDIKDPANFLFKVSDPEDVVRRVSESALRETVAQTQIAQLILRTSGDGAATGAPLANARETVRAATMTRLQTLLDEYGAGINVRDVLLQGGDPPAEVIQSFRDVDIAGQNADRQRNQATAYANRIKEEVFGQVQRILEEARGYAATVTAEADGQASRFNQVLAAYWQSPDVVRQRLYIDTLGRVLADIQKIILESGDVADAVVPYLPLPEMQGRPPRPEAANGTDGQQGAGQ